MEVALGLLIGFVEGWSVGEAVYFSFVTGLTIGYGDIVPRQTLTHFQERMPYGPFVP
jgi:ion channel